MMAKYDLKDRVVIITGASQGLGKEFAFGFAESGAFVVLAARKKNQLDEIAREIPTDVKHQKAKQTRFLRFLKMQS